MIFNNNNSIVIIIYICMAQTNKIKDKQLEQDITITERRKANKLKTIANFLILKN